MLLDFKLGQTSIVLRVKIRNSSVSTGAGLTGLTSASSGLRIAVIADNESTTTAYTAAGSTIETISTLGTYAAPTATKCRFKEVDATSHPGVYEVQIADARFAVSSARSVLVSISGATNAAECDALIPLRSVDPYNANFGLTNLDAAITSRMATYTQPTGFLAATFPTTVASPTNITGGTITTVTTLTNLPTAPTDWLTSAAVSAGAVTKIQAGLSTYSGGAVASVTGNVGGNVVGSVGSVASGGITSASFAAGAIDASAIATDAIGALELAAGAASEIAAAVWDLATSGHTTAGTFGSAMNAAGSAGDPWATSLPGAYGSGTAGNIVGTNLNATVSSRSTYAGGAVASVTGAVGSVTNPVTVGTNSDKTGYSLNLAQTGLSPRALDVVADSSLTIGDALVSAVSVATGKASVSGTSYLIKTPSTGTTIRSFTLDSSTDPTSRS